MRVTVQHQCGHEHQHRTYSAMTEALLRSFQSAPCPDCASGGYTRRKVEKTAVTCGQCGMATTVPFKPAGNRPVYCRTCWESKKAEKR